MPDTRAMLRIVNTGWRQACAHCGEDVKWVARKNAKVVLANVYEGEPGARRWDRLEAFHPACYEEAGQPHGTLDTHVAAQYTGAH